MDVTMGPSVPNRQTAIESVTHGRIEQLKVQGRIVLGDDAVPALYHAVLRYLGADIELVVLDLGAVTKIDAFGLGILAKSYSKARSLGVRLELVNTPWFIDELLKVTSLDKCIPSRGHDRQ
jgi:anti-anti-sigma factor